MTACYVFVYGQEDISSDLTRENTSQLKSVSEYSQRGQWVAGSVDVPENTKTGNIFPRYVSTK